MFASTASVAHFLPCPKAMAALRLRTGFAALLILNVGVLAPYDLFGSAALAKP
jgi:hypothetical protein